MNKTFKINWNIKIKLNKLDLLENKIKKLDIFSIRMINMQRNNWIRINS